MFPNPSSTHVNPKSVVKILNSVVKYRSFQVQISPNHSRTPNSPCWRVHILFTCCCCHKVNPSSNKALLFQPLHITFLHHNPHVNLARVYIRDLSLWINMSIEHSCENVLYEWLWIDNYQIERNNMKWCFDYNTWL